MNPRDETSLPLASIGDRDRTNYGFGTRRCLESTGRCRGGSSHLGFPGRWTAPPVPRVHRGRSPVTAALCRSTYLHIFLLPSSAFPASFSKQRGAQRLCSRHPGDPSPSGERGPVPPVAVHPFEEARAPPPHEGSSTFVKGIELRYFVILFSLFFFYLCLFLCWICSDNR